MAKGNLNRKEKNDDARRGKRERKGQWAKGQSGNPNGRPKKQAAPPDDFLTTLIAAANEIVDVNLAGQPAQITAVQLLARQMMMQALKSKGLDQVRLVNLFERMGLFAALAQQREEAAKEQQGVAFYWTDEIERRFQELEAEFANPPEINPDEASGTYVQTRDEDEDAVDFDPKEEDGSRA